jgi:hypothetical protein
VRHLGHYPHDRSDVVEGLPMNLAQVRPVEVPEIVEVVGPTFAALTA